MLTRRGFGLTWVPQVWICFPEQARAETSDVITIRIRADETVRSLLSPIELHNLTIEPDHSQAAQDMAARAPPGRAVPIILIIVGALALTQIAQIVRELARQSYYGGVLIDGRKSPPEVSNDPKIPANMVFVFQQDGSVQHFASANMTTDLLASLLSAKR
jgi:hypothetical protein